MTPLDADLWVLCATPAEAAAVGRVLQGPLEEIRLESKRATAGRLGSRSCLTLAAGVGPRKLEKTLQVLDPEPRPRLLVNFGAAGAISDELEIGDLTVPYEIVAYSWPDLRCQGETLRLGVEPLARALPDVRITRAGSCPHDVRDEAVRRHLRENLVLDTTDWETYAVAAWCKSRGINFLALRCVTDRAGASARAEYRESVERVLERGASALASLVDAWFKANSGNVRGSA